jgi:hypothetical protein
MEPHELNPHEHSRCTRHLHELSRWAHERLPQQHSFKLTIYRAVILDQKRLMHNHLT